VEATDGDDDALTYALGGKDAGLFEINKDGEITLKAPADFEAQDSYTIDVIVSDGTNTDTQTVTITVDDVNEAQVISSGMSAEVAEDAAIDTVVYQVEATDPDGDTLTYSLDGEDADAFTISDTGEVMLNVALDFEAQRTPTSST